MEDRKPDPRFQEFQEEFDADGTVIGFKIPGNNFLFEYNQAGGWRDQKGKLFDKDGFPLDEEFNEQQESQSADDSQIDDDQIVDEFEQMLIEQQEGIIHKPKPQKKAKQPLPVDYKQIDFEEQTKKYIEKLKNKEQTRQGVSQNIWIFFKMRSGLYERIVPEVEKQQTVEKRNEVVKSIKAKIEQKRKELLSKNPWLKGQFILQYSGSSLDQNLYDRYWYGWVKVNNQNYLQTIQQMKKSNEFAILKSKTFYALKSKFYLKNKMKQTIVKLREQLKEVQQNGAVLVKLNNLPEEFPLSFILDLIQLSGGFLQDVQEMDIVDDFSADLIVKKRTAQIITNIQGYSHDEKQFIWIETQNLKRPFKYNSTFNIQVDAPYKIPLRQLHDTLALQNGRTQLLKVHDKQCKDFRLVAHQNVIRKLLMYRGQTLNIVRIVRFQQEKKQQKKQEKKQQKKQ